MTPKQKAKELIDKFFDAQIEIHGDIFIGITGLSKKCAVICVDEIMAQVIHPMNPINDKDFDYWSEVKIEIDNILKDK